MPVIETERLILRPPEAGDFEPMAALMADEEATRYIGGVMHRAIVWRSICVMAGGWALFGFSMFSVVEKASGRWIGRLGPWRPEAWPGTEVGWGLVRDAWGKGYATEGAAAAMDFAFDALGWSDVIHCIDARNAASKKVATRLGSRFLREAELPPPFQSKTEVWGQSRAEWRARAGRRSP